MLDTPRSSPASSSCFNSARDNMPSRRTDGSDGSPLNFVKYLQVHQNGYCDRTPHSGRIYTAHVRGLGQAVDVTNVVGQMEKSGEKR